MIKATVISEFGGSLIVRIGSRLPPKGATAYQDTKKLGQVVEVFGPVKAPYAEVRLKGRLKETPDFVNI